MFPKKMFFLIVVSVLCLVFGFTNTGDPEISGYLLSENFENYPPGVFPSVGGWQLIHSGWGAGYQVIVDTDAQSGAQSWKLEGRRNWAATVYRGYSLPDPAPDIIFFECKAKSTRLEQPIIGYRDFAIWAGQVGTPTGSHAFASVDFIPDSDGKEYLYFHNYRYKGPEIFLGRWYHIKVRLNLQDDTGTVWLDDVQVITEVPLYSTGNYHYAPGITIEGGNSAHTRSWVDDVLAYTVPPTVRASIDLDPDTLSLKNKGKWVTAYIELPEEVDIQLVNTGSVGIVAVAGRVLDEPIMAASHPVGYSGHDENGVPELKVKFCRKDLQQELLPGEEVSISIEGDIGETQRFEGMDTIRVINPPEHTSNNLRLYDDFSVFDSTRWEVITENTGNFTAENGLGVLDTGYHGGVNLIAKQGYNLQTENISMVVRVQCNFNYIYGNDFSIGLRNRYNSHEEMIDINKLHDPQYGPNLDNYDQFRFVTRTAVNWYYSPPVTANFTDFVQIEYRCTAGKVELYIDDILKGTSTAFITDRTIYPFFRAGNADRRGAKSMCIDWIRVTNF